MDNVLALLVSSMSSIMFLYLANAQFVIRIVEHALVLLLTIASRATWITIYRVAVSALMNVSMDL